MGILDKISDFANKAADKLIPKELAPFLPIAGAFLPGLGLAGTSAFSKFLIPQLLTAASSAKMQGEIDPTQQAITGILTALQGPTQQTGAEKALLEQNPELAKQVTKANILDDAVSVTDKARLKELLGAKAILKTQVSKKGEDMKGKFGRILGDFMTDDGRKCADILCEEGHAVTYHGGSKDDIQSQHMKNRLKLIKKGIVKGPAE